MSLVAGVDSSTQSCKVLIIDAETGTVVRAGKAAHPDATEVDPDHWWLALRSAIERAGGLDDVAAVSIAGQQHGMVALDAAGSVVRPALLWNDTRSAAAARDLIAEWGAETLARRVGSVPVASFTATKLRWLRDQEPDKAARVAAVALPHDWLTWRLRGFGPDRPDLDELVTDRSEASGTGYWSPTTGQYDMELLTAALGREVTVPRVLAPAARAGVADGVVIGPGAGDNAAGALGLNCGPGDAVVSIGTSGTVFAVTQEPVTDASGTVAGFADAQGGFLPLIATLNAARVLELMGEVLDVSHDGLGKLAMQAPPGAGGAVLVPYFAGERTPNRPEATASLHGLSMSSSRRTHVARASIEGMLCGLADGLDAILNLGVPARRVLLIGGAARNTAVATVAAQVFDFPVVVPRPQEYVARGAALQAAWALSGTHPRWPLKLLSEFVADHQPVIREQYHHALESIWPGAQRDT